jgi:serine acetyltransferase
MKNFILSLKSDLNVLNEFYSFERSFLRLVASKSFIAVFLIRCVTCTSFFFSPLGLVSKFLLYLLFHIEIARRCKVGEALFLPHPWNLVLGCREIGQGVTIMHNVTLGSYYLDSRFDSFSRPLIEDNCFLGVGCVIIGGGSLLEGSRVLPNAFVNLKSGRQT